MIVINLIKHLKYTINSIVRIIALSLLFTFKNVGIDTTFVFKIKAHLSLQLIRYRLSDLHAPQQVNIANDICLEIVLRKISIDFLENFAQLKRVLERLLHFDVLNVDLLIINHVNSLTAISDGVLLVNFCLCFKSFTISKV